MRRCAATVLLSSISASALEFFEIDELGLDWMDIRILETLAKTFSGRAVGLTTLASAVGEDPGTLEDVYEPICCSAA